MRKNSVSLGLKPLIYMTWGNKDKQDKLYVPDMFYTESQIDYKWTAVELYLVVDGSIKSVAKFDCLSSQGAAGLQASLTLDVFTEHECAVCRMPDPIVAFTDSPHGLICHSCWSRAKPALPWKPVTNLEPYIKKEDDKDEI